MFLAFLLAVLLFVFQVGTKAENGANKGILNLSRKVGGITYTVKRMSLCHPGVIMPPGTLMLSIYVEIHNSSSRTFRVFPTPDTLVLVLDGGRRIKPTPLVTQYLKRGERISSILTFLVNERQCCSNMYLASNVSSFPPIKLPVSCHDVLE